MITMILCLIQFAYLMYSRSSFSDEITIIISHYVIHPHLMIHHNVIQLTIWYKCAINAIIARKSKNLPKEISFQIILLSLFRQSWSSHPYVTKWGAWVKITIILHLCFTPYALQMTYLWGSSLCGRDCRTNSRIFGRWGEISSFTATAKRPTAWNALDRSRS